MASCRSAWVVAPVFSFFFFSGWGSAACTLVIRAWLIFFLHCQVQLITIRLINLWWLLFPSRAILRCASLSPTGLFYILMAHLFFFFRTPLFLSLHGHRNCQWLKWIRWVSGFIAAHYRAGVCTTLSPLAEPITHGMMLAHSVFCVIKWFYSFSSFCPSPFPFCLSLIHTYWNQCYCLNWCSSSVYKDAGSDLTSGQ